MPLTSFPGNQKLKEQLLPRLSGAGLGHALILAGTADSGRDTLTSILARAMVCSGEGVKPCDRCPGCKKALAGIHPDIVTIAPLEEGKAITVDQVRQMRSDAFIRPNEARRKVYVMEQADRMRVEAQNAMLKLLEEGPTYAAFLLLAENAGGLLPTVRSRCETLSLTRETESNGQEDESSADLAGKLVECWLAGREGELMELCVGLESWDRAAFTGLMDHMDRQLCAQLPRAKDRRRVLQAVQLVGQLRHAAADRNVNPGHLAGWLCASACAAESL